MERIVKMDCNEFEDILYSDEYKEITLQKIEDQDRWYTYVSQVFQKKDDGTFWELSWRRGSTEQQYEGPEDIRKLQVYPVEKTITVYEPKPKSE